MDMCDPYVSTLTASALRDHSTTYGQTNNNINYCNKNNTHPEIEMKTTSNAYYDLVSSRQYRHEDWKSKFVKDWTDDDTVSWLIEYTVSQGFNECDVPFYNFKVSGIELKNMKRDEVIKRMAHPNVDPHLSIKMADRIFIKLQDLSENSQRKSTLFSYTENDPYKQHASEQSVLDLDEYRQRTASDYQNGSLLPALEFKDSEDSIPTSSSSLFSYSNTNQSMNEEDKTKITKKPLGRPKGSGKNNIKRPPVYIPEFLWNLLLDEKYRDIIDWKDYSQLKFRFIKPDEVAKLWGQMKQNENMTFEKFSRAMRYHYRQKVLVSVPTARLVYQFGCKGPDFRTQNPNFVKVKSEVDLQDMSYS